MFSLRRLYWQYRLRHAQQYRSGLEQVFANERAKAEHEVAECQQALKRISDKEAELATEQRFRDVLRYQGFSAALRFKRSMRAAQLKLPGVE